MKTYTLYHNYDFFNKKIVSNCLRDLQNFMLGNGCKCEILSQQIVLFVKFKLQSHS
mgnify:CR=1 FL=1